MKEIEITEPKTISQTLGLSALYMQALVDMFEHGVGPGDGGVPYYWKDKAICAVLDGEIIGFIAYRLEDGDGALSLMCGYVVPMYRRGGVYTKLWSKLVEIAKESKCARIWGSTHVDNKPMREFYKKLGRVETHVNSNFVVE